VPESTLVNGLSYPGLTAYDRTNYVLSHGSAPSPVTIDVPPSFGTISEVGDVVMDDGTNPAHTVPDCKVLDIERAATIQSQGGTLILHDHRWRWRFPTISGRYNVPEPRTDTVPLMPQPAQPPPPGQLPPDQPPAGEEPIKPETKKTARELARLCLEKMQEDNYSLDGLDEGATPFVDWDVTNAAQALEQLANLFGCKLVYQPNRQKVLIAKKGEGDSLPDGPQTSSSLSFDVSARPSRVRVYGARTRYQRRFFLEPVGREFDGSIRPLGELSYRPATGEAFEDAGPPPFANLQSVTLPGAREPSDAKALAADSVYKCYRIVNTDFDGEGLLRIPADGPDETSVVRSVDKVRLLPFLNQSTKDDLGRYSLAGARVFGRHTPLGSDIFQVGRDIATAYEQTFESTEVRVPFKVDSENSMIVFERYVYGLYGGVYHQADIVLECACEVEDNDTHQLKRWSKEREVIGGQDTAPADFVAEELRYKHTTNYNYDRSGATFEEGFSDNEDDLQDRANELLLAEALRYQTDQSDDRTYPGIRGDIQPDGAIQQMTFSLGGGSAQNLTTRASRNTEHSFYHRAGQRQAQQAVDFDNLRRDRERQKQMEEDIHDSAARTEPTE
jgi:hypothetical protein